MTPTTDDGHFHADDAEGVVHHGFNRKVIDGSLPIIGVNTFLPKEHAGETATIIELIRATENEKLEQIANVRAFQQARNSLASLVGAAVSAAISPLGSLARLQQTARERKNVFAALMEAVKSHSLCQISHALYAVGSELPIPVKTATHAGRKTAGHHARKPPPVTP